MTAQTDALAAGLQALAEALRNACNDPTDGIRLLTNLAAFTVQTVASTAPIGASIAVVATATASLCRRAALTSLARATASYQPSSYDDALSVSSAVCSLLDMEATVAADSGDTATYLAIKALRTAVAADLQTRGALLPRLITITQARPLPSLVLAWMLYQDASRCDDLVARADPVAPLFMPTAFEALSS